MISLNIEMITSVIKLTFFILYFLCMLLLIVYNWLYLTHTFRANKNIGLNPPEKIRHLVRTSTYIALFNAILLVFFLVMGYY